MYTFVPTRTYTYAHTNTMVRDILYRFLPLVPGLPVVTNHTLNYLTLYHNTFDSSRHV